MDLNKNFENATVTIPYNDFVKCLMAASAPPDPEFLLNQQAEYINALVGDVVNGEIPLEEAEDFAFFRTDLGKFIILNIENFKSVYAEKKV